MFNKKFAAVSILAFTLSLLSVKAHWVDDTGPVVVEGNRNNLTTDNGGGYYTEWKSWKITDNMQDSQNNDTLTVEVSHKKVLDYDEKNCKGDAYCQAWSAERISGEYTKGKYDVHARARGKWWYRSDREKNSHFGGGAWDAEKGVERDRWFKFPTYSGVHLKGKAHVSNQAGGLRTEMNWF